jgi:hypothetical protein
MATSVEFSVQMLSLQEQRRIEVLLEWNLPCPLFSWFLDNRKAIEEINGAPLLENKPATISRDETCGRKLLAGI